MEEVHSWTTFYPEAAKNYDETSIVPHHLAEVVGIAAQKYGASPAISTQLPNGACSTLNFVDVDRLTDDFAVYLREIARLQPGEAVALMSPNCIGFVLAVFGIFKAGCICTNINPLYTAAEMQYQLKNSGAKVLLIIDLFGDKAKAAVVDTSIDQVISMSLLDFFPPLKKAIMGFVMKRIRKMIPRMGSSHVTMAGALKSGAAWRKKRNPNVERYRAEQSIDSTALYQYTGGTTGRSKGAELTHRNILCNAAMMMTMVSEKMDAAGGDTTVVALPLYHITAFALIMLPGIEYGVHCVLIPSPRPASNMKPAFENHAVTYFTGINTLFAALLEEPWCTSDLFRKLRFCGSGGAAQHIAVAERWEALTGVPISQGYGLTECAGVLTATPVDENRPGSVGIPVPGMNIRIVDEEGKVLPSGDAGEIIAKGATIMKGYLDLPEITAESIRDGWLYTGDIGVMDENGFIRIVDRKKDMILVSGFNVYPNEIEDVISRIDNVVEVGVIGVPDDKTGESVKAFVVSTDPEMTATQVIAHCKEFLTNYKLPRQVEFVDEIPKTPVGKVLRRHLRAMDEA